MLHIFFEQGPAQSIPASIHLSENERLVCGYLHSNGLLECRRNLARDDGLLKIEDFREELQLAPAGKPTMHYDDEIGPYPLYPGAKGQFTIPDDFQWYVLVRSPRGARIIFAPKDKPTSPPLSWDLRARVANV